VHEPPRSKSNTLVRAQVVLTFTSGVVDAVSFLGLGRVFTANMTGNVVLLGFGIAGSAGLPTVAPLLSLAFFLLGATAGGELARRVGDDTKRHVAVALSAEGALIAIAAVVAAAVDIRPLAFSGDTLIGLIALAMGFRNATTRHLAVPDLPTTVLTMTLTAFAADAPNAAGERRNLTRRGAAVFAMLTGAVAGALMLKSSLVLPLLAAAGLALVAWLVYTPAARPSA
jgi:uncharacterized membrane protein YoaK (UPF0700 family)